MPPTTADDIPELRGMSPKHVKAVREALGPAGEKRYPPALVRHLRKLIAEYREAQRELADLRSTVAASAASTTDTKES